jgi:L-2-amino-thiazoline-4-carboxylic acid hydrolase
MNVSALFLFPFPALAFRRAAHVALGNVYSPEESKLVWARTTEIHSAAFKSRKRNSLGVDFVLRYFEWNYALYKSLQEFGLAKERVGPVIEAINWAVFGSAIRISFNASWLRSSVLKTRVRWVCDLMFRTLFTHPFQRTVLPSENDVAFNVTVCPFAQFFQEQGVPELTRYAACSLDLKMAQDWGVEFKRRQTIAEGHPLCDFRFKIPTNQTPPSPQS